MTAPSAQDVWFTQDELVHARVLRASVCAGCFRPPTRHGDRSKQRECTLALERRPRRPAPCFRTPTNVGAS